MGKKLKFDFTGVEKFVKCAEGEHVAILKTIEEKISSSGNEMLAVCFEVVKGDSKGAKVYDNFMLSKNMLWKLKSYLEAVSIGVEGEITLDIDSLVGRRCIIDVIHEEYNGAMKSRINTYKRLEQNPIEVEKQETWDEDTIDDWEE